MSLFWHVTAACGFIHMISMRMESDCVQCHVRVRLLDFDGYGDAKFWASKKDLCA